MDREQPKAPNLAPADQPVAARRRPYQTPAVETAEVALPALLTSSCLSSGQPTCDGVTTPVE